MAMEAAGLPTLAQYVGIVTRRWAPAGAIRSVNAAPTKT